MRSCASIPRNWIAELQQSEQMKQCLTIINILSNLIKDDALKRTLEALRIKVVSLELEGPVQFANLMREILAKHSVSLKGDKKVWAINDLQNKFELLMNEVDLNKNFSLDRNQILAKEQEASLKYLEMQEQIKEL